MSVNWSDADLAADREAWNRATEELPRAPLSTVLKRAQEIKDEIRNDKDVHTFLERTKQS